MRRCARMLPALFGGAGIAVAVGVSGVGALPVGITGSITPASVVAPPSAAPVGSQACIIGLNCGCIRYRTCPGDRRRPPVRAPEPQLGGEVPVVTSEHGVAPAALTRTPAWASPSA
jgi:hypothetical protein